MSNVSAKQLLDEASPENGFITQENIDNFRKMFEIVTADMDPRRPPYIVERGNGRETVHPALLANWAHENLPYLIVQNASDQALKRYIYRDGVFVLSSHAHMVDMLRQQVEAYDTRLVVVKQLDDAVKLLEGRQSDTYTIDELNPRQELINFQDCMIGLGPNRELIEIEHGPQYRSTIQLPCDAPLEPESTPVFDDFLNQLVNGDSDRKKTILQFMGLTLSNYPGYLAKKTVILKGPGDSGKSQIIRLLQRLLGPANWTACELSELEQTHGLAPLYGKRMAGSADMSFIRVKELMRLKQLTGGDGININGKNQQQYSYIYRGTLWWACNELPMFGGDLGQWVYDRICVIECPNSVPKNKQDPLLLEKLYQERKGIIYKSLMALMDLRDNNFRLHEGGSTLGIREQYKIDNSGPLEFIDEHMMPTSLGMEKTATCKDVYKIFQCWARDNLRGYVPSKKEFEAAVLTRLGAARRKDATVEDNGYVFWKDLMLRPEIRLEYENAIDWSAPGRRARDEHFMPATDSMLEVFGKNQEEDNEIPDELPL